MASTMRVRSAILLVAASFLALSLAACAWVPPSGRSAGCAFSLDVTPRVRFGPVTGNLQTGLGGEPGTSSRSRPTLHEIGIRTAVEAGLEVDGTWSRNALSLAGSELWLRGGGTLGHRLVSQGATFPPGTSVQSGSSIGFGRLGYRRRFDLPLGGAESLHVWPGVGVDYLDFRYLLSGSARARASRSYAHVAPDVGLLVSWRPADRGPFELSAHASQSLSFLLPRSNRLNVLEADARARYRLDAVWSVDLSVGYQHLEFEDAQALPNHPDVWFGPFVGLGITASF